MSNKRPGRPKTGKNRKKNPTLIQYKPKHWDTSFRNNTYNIEEIESRFYNNLPIDDIIDTMNNKYNSRKRKNGKDNPNKDL